MAPLLQNYKYERPHRDYCDMGRRSIETIEVGKLIREQMQKAANYSLTPKGLAVQ